VWQGFRFYGREFRMNRILQFLQTRACDCCRAHQEIEHALEVAAVECERIEIAAGDEVLEFWLPSAERYLKPGDDDDRGIRFMLLVKSQGAGLDDDLARHTCDELRRIAGELTAAADRIGGAA
jgi:hypothetical protein